MTQRWANWLQRKNIHHTLNSWKYILQLAKIYPTVHKNISYSSWKYILQLEGAMGCLLYAFCRILWEHSTEYSAEYPQQTSQDNRTLRSYKWRKLGPCAIWNIHPKHILNSNLTKTCLPITYFAVAQSFWKFAQGMTVTLPCSVQNLKTFWQLIWMLWTNEILWDFSSIWIFGISYIVQPPKSLIWCDDVLIKSVSELTWKR